MPTLRGTFACFGAGGQLVPFNDGDIRKKVAQDPCRQQPGNAAADDNGVLISCPVHFCLPVHRITFPL
jgi:hypothetical protein